MSSAASTYPVSSAPQRRFPTTLADVLVGGAVPNLDTDALVFPDQRMTYRELLDKSWEFAHVLEGLGIRPHDRIGTLTGNCPEAVVSMFGIAFVGAIVVPINARYRHDEIDFLVRNAELTAVVTTGRNADYLDLRQVLDQAVVGLDNAPDKTHLSLERYPALDVVVSIDSSQSSALQVSARGPASCGSMVETWSAGVSARSDAAIVYTSGTTSRPSGAVLTNEALVRTWMTAGMRWEIGRGDRMWDPCPMFHIAGLGPLVFTLGNGATYVTDYYFRPDRALKQISEEAPTLMYPTYPPITEALLADPAFPTTDFTSVRAFLNVAPPDMLRTMQAAVPGAVQLSVYGSTEAGPLAMHRISDSLETRLSTCGPPLPGVEVAVVDPASGASCATDVVGEIRVRGYNLLSCYYNDPEKTASTIDSDGWIHTGDLGTIDAAGYLGYVGRSKDMLKVGGENVAPLEVEEFLAGHPSVKLVQVVGIPDPRLVEVPAAFIELHDGADGLSEADVVLFCHDRIASFKVPRIVRFVDQWPMSATKIQRNKLRDDLIAELNRP